MDFDSFSKAGVALGSGALLICDEDTCVVDLAKVLVELLPQRILRKMQSLPHRQSTRL